MVETASVNSVTHYPGVDWQQCLVLADNNEGLANELLSMFTDGLPEDADLLSAAFNRHDYSALKDQAHKMHGALCYCAIPAMKQAMMALENACIEVIKDSGDTEAVVLCYADIKNELDLFLAYLD
jgi:HPt (histidine-containing phosphotransfer) domain-containing protein